MNVSIVFVGGQVDTVEFTPSQFSMVEEAMISGETVVVNNEETGVRSRINGRYILSLNVFEDDAG